jgi:hypothetical protein
MPVVSGPSGHAGSALLLAMLAGNFDQQELLQYVAANTGELVGGGLHSIHEIGVVAAQVGLPYQSGNYISILPDSFKSDQSYRTLQAQFPSYLPYQKSVAQQWRNIDALAIIGMPCSVEHDYMSSLKFRSEGSSIFVLSSFLMMVLLVLRSLSLQLFAPKSRKPVMDSGFYATAKVTAQSTASSLCETLETTLHQNLG